MPFGPVNCPQTFIDFMHNMGSTWKLVVVKRGVPIEDDCNTCLIFDDLMNFAPTFQMSLQYMRAQFQVAQSQNLSLKIRKCHWFPERSEFVGVDVTIDGNRPAQSKHQLLQSWPIPTIVQDVASFVGFAIFYSNYILLFEVRVKRLQELMKLEYILNQLSNFGTQQLKLNSMTFVSLFLPIPAYNILIIANDFIY
jgi:hypothetical protein